MVFYLDDSEICTKNLNFDFKFQVFLSHRDRKLIHSLTFWEKLWRDNFEAAISDEIDNQQKTVQMVSLEFRVSYATLINNLYLSNPKL